VLELCEPSCRHPLTVIVSLAVVLLLAVVVLGLCAMAPNVVAKKNAAAIDAVRFIVHLCGTNVCNQGTDSKTGDDAQSQRTTITQ
jgi:hypothetical protein